MAERPGAGRLPAVRSRTGGGVQGAERGSAACPCGGVPEGATFDACCAPVVRGEVLAATAVQLMRSRYAAYAVADGDHLFRTWHARTRPAVVEPDPRVRWTGLEVIAVVDGGTGDATGVVEFRARWDAGEGGTRQHGELHERSRFERRAGRWMYVEAT